ncbi:MAG: hypothetical protein HZC47_10560 [Methanobacterium sp.]|uniref:hypothetical protein n=1 Tax=Methanobacterium sp. TaxID=2164 RepID=UPI003D65CEFB|nr:hypothetical protein [Methanobacterium sp.]
MNSKKSDVEKNIESLTKKFKSIADVTFSFGRYDIVLYNYDEIEELTAFIEEIKSIGSWTVLKTRVSPESNIDLV